MRNLTNEQGRSLVEMLAVVCIIGVLTVGAISATGYGLQSMRLTSLYETVESTASGVSDLYSWSRAYPTEGMGAKIEENDICEGCENQDGNAVTTETPLLKMTVSPNDGASFHIILSSHDGESTIPVDICNRLADFAWQNVEWESPESCTESTNEIRFIAY